MWKCLALGCTLVGTALAQTTSAQLELANLREDVRGLTQRVSELMLRLEQVERENAELRARDAQVAKSYATLTQLKEAVGDLNQNIRAAVDTSKSDVLATVAEQMKELAKRTNTALEAMARHQGATTSFAEDFSKEGISYEVQKGDTIAVIARKTGAKVQDIINANKLADPSRIVVGQKLFIPGGK